MVKNHLIENNEKNNVKIRKYLRIQGFLFLSQVIILKIYGNLFPDVANKVIEISEIINPIERIVCFGLSCLFVFSCFLHIPIAIVWIRSVYKKRGTRNQNIS